MVNVCIRRGYHSRVISWLCLCALFLLFLSYIGWKALQLKSGLVLLLLGLLLMCWLGGGNCLPWDLVLVNM